MTERIDLLGRVRLAALVMTLGGCGADEVMTARAVLGLGTIPARVASLSVQVFDEEGLVVSATVSPARNVLDLGVPAEVPLLFQVIARTATPAPARFGGGLPAFVARAERVIPLTQSPVRVGLEARPAGGLILDVDGSAPDGTLVIRSGIDIGVRVPWGDQQPSGSVIAVLERGRQQVSYETVDEERGDDITVRGGDALWVSPEVVSIAEVRVGDVAPTDALSVEVQSTDGTPIDPVVGPDGPVELTVRLLDDGEEQTDPDRTVDLIVDTTGTAEVSGWPSQVRGLPARLPPVRATGTGRVSVRASTTQGLSSMTVFNVGDPPTAPVALVLDVANPDRLADGTFLEVWTVDEIGRLTPPPAGRLSLAQSDPWLVRPDGDLVILTPDDARLSLRIALTSRPLGRNVVARADLFADTGTLSASLGLR